MKNRITYIMLVFGVLLSLSGFIMDYYNFSSNGLMFGYRVHSIQKNYINGFSLKIIGFFVFVLGASLYLDISKEKRVNSKSDFEKAKDFEKLLKKIKKSKK